MVTKYTTTTENSTASSTLSPRGATLAAQPDLRALLTSVNGDLYDPKTNPDGMINLAAAENYCMLPKIAQYISDHRLDIDLSPFDFSYNEGPWGCKRLREGLAKHFNRRFRAFRQVDEADICITNGTTTTISMLGTALAEPGEGVLMSAPIYQAFPNDFSLQAGVKAVHVPFRDVDQFTPEGVRCYEEALLKARDEGMKVRMVLLCHPHNPLGRCYPPETLVELMRFCDKYSLHLLSDEIYAMSVYGSEDDEGEQEFNSVVSFDTDPYIRKELLHVLYGLSKDFAAGGLRLGCLYTRNEELRRAINTLTIFYWQGIADQRVTIQILEDEEWLDNFFTESRQRLKERCDLTKKLLGEKGIKYYEKTYAGFFLWIDLRPFLATSQKSGWEAEEEIAKKMWGIKALGVNGRTLGAEEPGWFRIVFSQPETTLREGLKRIFEMLEV